MTALVEVTSASGIAQITFNRPRASNAINASLAEEFAGAVEHLVRNQDSKVVILVGNGRSFLVGGDLKEFGSTDQTERAKLSRSIIAPLHQALSLLEHSHLISIASLHGAVAGGGMGIALMTDLAVAADDTRFNMAYTTLAASPDCGASYALPRLVGQRRALEIALLSETLSAQEALALGLVNRVVPVAQLQDASRDLARALAMRSRESLSNTKRLLRRSWDNSLEAQLSAECDAFATLSATAEFGQALDKFLHKKD